MGFMGIDRLAESLSMRVDKEKFQAIIGETVERGEKIILAKPLTFMNLSGQSVRAMFDWYKPDISDLVVLFDDMDIPVGQIRLRMKGSAGGHNGIKSLIQHLGTQEFHRIKMGIGRPPTGIDVIHHVLSPFRKEEQPNVEKTIAATVNACACIIENSFELAMNRFNEARSKAKPDDFNRKQSTND
ncbi:aminoacyl-tRNA hydrolase [Fodinisporobacter ferrooxydans]|uniref:Peptidyl-tRNA hydrolase n=2 Tax=Fodinisporobacter ferrooxydans TaxID=2901836 RepID=A0ABY4CR81_9BACL|nr:aminoacyl-tRNA hydrolase [Alicyclobacillaceae bacterium MYW30-H2]